MCRLDYVPAMQAVDGIRAFWKWWESGRHRVLSAIEVERGFSQALVDDIASHVAAIGGDLDWELGAGTTSRHAFFLSAKGDPEGRLLTELWRSMGPAPDDVWSYFPARQPRGEGNTIEMDGIRFAIADARVQIEVEDAREKIHVAFYHPAFDGLDENARGTIMFLLLDGELGEDGVERWLGGIELKDDASDTASIAELREAVAKLAREATGEKFAIFQGESDGQPLVATVNLALKRIDYLLFTQHVAVDIAIVDQNPQGLPTNGDADVLNALEDELLTALEDHVAYFGRLTRPGVRTLHCYTPEDSPARSIIERWGAAHPERYRDALFAHDPTWEFKKRF